MSCPDCGARCTAGVLDSAARLEQDTLHFEPETLARLRRIAAAASLGEGSRRKGPPMLPFELKSGVPALRSEATMTPFELRAVAPEAPAREASAMAPEATTGTARERIPEATPGPPESAPPALQPSERAPNSTLPEEQPTSAFPVDEPTQSTSTQWAAYALVVIVALLFGAFIWLVSQGVFD